MTPLDDLQTVSPPVVHSKNPFSASIISAPSPNPLCLYVYLPWPVSSSHGYAQHQSMDIPRSMCGGRLHRLMSLNSLCPCEDRTYGSGARNRRYLYFYVQIPDLCRGTFPFYPFILIVVLQAGIWLLFSCGLDCDGSGWIGFARPSEDHV
jgi:hypothetical protein